jgi:phospholipid transport system transporter-binding protein
MPNTLVLPDTATLATADALLGTLQTALADSDGALQIDATALTNFDTSAVAFLLQAQRLGQAAGRPVTVRGAPAKLLELAQLYGVDGLLSVA